MLRYVINSGQAGCEQAALRAAHRVGLETGGYAPWHWQTEDGQRPEFYRLYGLLEHWSAKPARATYCNVADSDLTLWLGRPGNPTTAAFRYTGRACFHFGRRLIVAKHEPRIFANLLIRARPGTLHITGIAESIRPGVGKEAEQFLYLVLGMVRDYDRS